MSLPFVQPRLLRGYGAEPPPWHRGTGDAELEELLASRERRLARLKGRLPAALSLARPCDPLASLAWLDTWTTAHWPRAMRRRWADPLVDPVGDWPRAGGTQATAYTMVVDVGVALGELTRCLAPAVDWGVDHFDDHAADGVGSFGRAVLLNPSDAADTPGPAVCSPIDLALMRFQATARGDFDEPFLAGLRPVLWATHRHLYVGPQAN